MAQKAGSYSDTYTRFKPHLLMVVSRIGYTFLYIFTEACFNHGMNPHVHITHRHIVTGIAMFPFAYFLERKSRPKLTIALFLEIFVLSILGVSLTLNMYFASLRYTSPTFLAAVVNTLAPLTFIIAVVLRMEVVNLRSPRGMAKVLRTFVSLIGVTTMTLYKGPVVKNFWHPIIHIEGNSVIHENWLKVSILAVTSCITWSMWYILQAFTLKRYPAPLSLTTWMSFVGAAQSAVFTAIVEHKPAAWTIGFNIEFWATLYAVVVCSGLAIFIQLCILGGLIVIIGLYLLLWGKDRDQEAQLKERSNLTWPMTGTMSLKHIKPFRLKEMDHNANLEQQDLNTIM
ncbi:hypothetical protein REPUB_Repub11eG0125800 [Reevesia pubescens]